MSKVEILPVEYGNSTLPESMIFQGGAEDKTRPIVFMIYLIKDGNRLILADAGCVTMPGFDMHDFIGPIKALENMGYSADDITDVIITHAHHDHIECVGSFKNARVYIQKDEFNAGKSYFSDTSKVCLFDDEIDVCDNVKVVKIGGHSYGSCIVEVMQDSEKTIIAGDECYMRDCIDLEIPTGASQNIEKSREFIQKYKNFKILLCHDKR